jgi:hypothetical protein
MTNDDEKKREILDYDANLLFKTGEVGLNVPCLNQELFRLHRKAK